jgi:hypothetical protein
MDKMAMIVILNIFYQKMRHGDNLKAPKWLILNTVSRDLLSVKQLFIIFFAKDWEKYRTYK